MTAVFAADAGTLSLLKVTGFFGPGRIRLMYPDGLDMVDISLWREDAIVLFDWLSSVDLDALPTSHPAEKQALADLHTRLEHETDIPGVTQEQIDAARQNVSPDTGR